MTDDKSLPGGQERIVRAVERVLAANQRVEREGVKITNLASGKTQVEVHAYDGDLTAAGERARHEFERQLGLASIPVEELENLRWLASIGQAAIEHGWKPEGNTLHEIESAPVKHRESVLASDDPDDLLARLTEITSNVAAPAPDAEATDVF